MCVGELTDGAGIPTNFPRVFDAVVAGLEGGGIIVLLLLVLVLVLVLLLLLLLLYADGDDSPFCCNCCNCGLWEGPRFGLVGTENDRCCCGWGC